MTVDIVIPVHGNWELTEQCLDTLPREAPIRKVIVVDDASPDDTASQLARRDDVEAVVLERNSGFAAACNAGAARSSADAVLFLNNDTIVPSGAIARLAATLEADPTIGAVGPRFLYADGTIQSAGIAFIGPLEATRLYAHLDGATPQANHARDDLLLNGAALLVRRDVYTALGGFHEGYRNGIEDIDLSMQIWAHGYRCRYEPAATILHLEGASRGKRPNDDANRALFAQRWNGALHAFPHLTWQDPPVIALSWKPRDALDVLVRDRILAMLKQYGGSRRALVHTPLGTATLRTVAHFDGRAFLHVAYGRRGADVQIVVPRATDDVRSLPIPDASRYWVPSQAAARALQGRGIPAASMSTFWLGAHAEPRPAPIRLERAVLLVASRERAESADASRVLRALAGIETHVVTYASATNNDIAATRAASLVVAFDEDPWGLFLSEALGAGAVVVARSTSAALELIPSAAFVGVAASQALADAVAEVRADFDRYAPRAARAEREVARRFPELYAGQRLRELARAAKHGIPEADVVAVTPELARSLRGRTPA